MCGICGILTFDKAASQPIFEQAVTHMMALMQRRGPDSDGAYLSPGGHLRLGFRRLAVLDLSTAANQPMISGDGRSVLVFNGELYNFQDLRRELEAHGVQFRTHADSEVVLEALNIWGPDALDRFNGMFAFGWYDLTAQRLLLARDHAGIKPLYIFQPPGQQGVAFASQLNCLFHTPWPVPAQPRPDVLSLYLRLHHTPPPYTLFDDITQLEPGHTLTIDTDDSVQKRTWWVLPRTPEPDLTGGEAVEALHATLDNAVRRQRIADVPLGVFLSGGVDSPLVTALARHQTGSALQAFTIGSPGWWQDEAAAASVFAHHLDVRHTVHNVTPADVLQTIEEVITAQTEPFADFSIIPTLLISRIARQAVTVALSGDGGDELFYGYERPLSLLRNGRDFRYPWPVRLALYGAGKYRLGPRRSDVIVFRSPGHYYFDVNSRLKAPDLRHIAPGYVSPPSDFTLYHFDRYQGERDLAHYSRWVEFYGQLQRGLKKVDLASMHHSLEVRVPLLDRDVIEVSSRIDPFTAMDQGIRKAVLRRVFERYVPPEMIPEDKRGFAVPLGEWLRGPLRELAEDTLFGGDLYPAGFFDRAGLQAYWQQHLSGQRNLKWGLWTLLSLQWWAKAHLPQDNGL